MSKNGIPYGSVGGIKAKIALDRIKLVKETLSEATAIGERPARSLNSTTLQQRDQGWGELVEKYWKMSAGGHRPFVFDN